MRYSARDALERSGVYRILRDMSEDMQELKDSQHEFQRETKHELECINQGLTRLENSEAKHDKDIEILKSDAAGLKDDMKEFRQDMKELRGEVREIAGNLSGMQTRLNWWLVAVGIIIAALEYLKH